VSLILQGYTIHKTITPPAVPPEKNFDNEMTIDNNKIAFISCYRLQGELG
jgi:hypothetical protein